MLRSLMAKLKNLQLLAPIAVSASTNSASADLADVGSVMFLVNAGNFAFDGSNKIDLKVQHCDDNSTWVDVDAADLYQPENGAIAKSLDAGGDADSVHAIHYLGYKRYARLALVVTGTVNVPVGASAVLGHLEAMPSA